MPVKTARRTHTSLPRHHKQTKKYLKPYWPYLPMLFIVVLGFTFGSSRPLIQTHKGVLAYATNVSPQGLLQASNAQRQDNKIASLSQNDLLTAAAQSKANDMATRNYWSHNTPDGQEPWIFIQKTGYSYSKAGENLAYGFTTSNDAITGWMNSPSHRANLLDSNFTQVGFGIANSNNYNQSGPETIIVAMYGQPQTAAADTSATTTKSAYVAPPTITKSIPVNTDTKLASEPSTQSITRIQALSGGQQHWSLFIVVLITSVALVILLLQHGIRFRKLIKDGEAFIIKHPFLDIALVVIVMGGYILTRTTGFIR